MSNISYSGLPEGYSAEVITQSLPVTLRGSAADLDVHQGGEPDRGGGPVRGVADRAT